VSREDESITTLDLNSLDLGEGAAQVVPLPGVHDVALDRAGNLVLATAQGLEQLDVDDDGALAAAPRTLLPFGDPLLPFAGCALLLSPLDGDVAVADTCTGAVLRLHVE
jgi:hypothetical protein